MRTGSYAPADSQGEFGCLCSIRICILMSGKSKGLNEGLNVASRIILTTFCQNYAKIIIYSLQLLLHKMLLLHYKNEEQAIIDFFLFFSDTTMEVGPTFSSCNSFPSSPSAA